MAALKSNDARPAPILGELAQWQNYTRDTAILSGRARRHQGRFCPRSGDRTAECRRQLLEFAPYLSLPDARLSRPLRVRGGSGYPASGSVVPEWQVTMAALAGAPVIVPAGSFQASRVELKGTRSVPSALHLARFQVTKWYAPGPAVELAS
jgi:hypothetical protein